MRYLHVELWSEVLFQEIVFNKVATKNKIREKPFLFFPENKWRNIFLTKFEGRRIHIDVVKSGCPRRSYKVLKGLIFPFPFIRLLERSYF